MTRFRTSLATLGVAAALAACSDQPTAPSIDVAPASFARGGGSATGCVGSPDFISADETSLRSAVASARSGDVIAIDGTIVLTEPLSVDTDGITLTCAHAGSGLTHADRTLVPIVIAVMAADFTLSGLEIDASAGGWPIYAVNDGLLWNATGLEIIGNRVRCGGGCMFLIGTEHARISGNHLEARYASTGIHLQQFARGDGAAFRTDGARIEGNTIVALQPTGNGSFGAIRPRDGDGVVVANNVIEGPWTNGIGLAVVSGARVEGNRVSAATQFALFISSVPSQAISTSGSLFRANNLSGAAAAIYVRHACDNVIVGNMLASSGDWEVMFEPSTGSNAFMGRGTAVMDDGDQDCDGDGSADPNAITGAGRRGTGGAIGPIVSSVIPTVMGQDIR